MSVLECSAPASGIIFGIYGSVKGATVLFMMSGWQLLMKVPQGTTSAPLLSCQNFPMLFSQGQWCNLPIYCTDIKVGMASDSGPWVLVRVFLPLYLLDLGAYPLFLTCEFLYSFLSGVQGGLVSDIHWTFPHSFLLLCWIHELCAVIFTGLVNGNTYELSS